MNGFAEHGLDESAFEDKSGLSQGLRSFDAFPKTKSTYTSASRRGGQLTVFLIIISFLITVSEFGAWYSGHETFTFTVEKGVSRELQINMDIIVSMKCEDLHINVQDAAGDRILAGDLLKRDPTSWTQWHGKKGIHKLHGEGENYEDEEIHVGDVPSLMRRRKFPKTPKLHGPYNSCRIYGSIDGNKVQGDFHITARGHGYMEYGLHLEHSAFNFSHVIRELSFGPYYPSILNPLDDTFETTPAHFYKFQYYLSLVPTVYMSSHNSIFTNQYAVTEQSRLVGERQVPGIFFKYDIEPIMLTVTEERASFLSLVVRLVNVVSGVVVAAGWCYQLYGWATDLLGRRTRRQGTEGMLGKRYATVEDAEDEDD